MNWSHSESSHSIWKYLFLMGIVDSEYDIIFIWACSVSWKDCKRSTKEQFYKLIFWKQGFLSTWLRANSRKETKKTSNRFFRSFIKQFHCWRCCIRTFNVFDVRIYQIKSRNKIDWKCIFVWCGKNLIFLKTYHCIENKLKH